MVTKWNDDPAERKASDTLTLYSASVVARTPEFQAYVATINWMPELIKSDDQWYSAWISRPGVNQYTRVPSLDRRTPGEVALVIARVMKGNVQVDREGNVTGLDDRTPRIGYPS